MKISKLNASSERTFSWLSSAVLPVLVVLGPALRGTLVPPDDVEDDVLGGAVAHVRQVRVAPRRPRPGHAVVL